MRRPALLIVVVFVAALVAGPASAGVAQTAQPAAAPTAGSLEADFNNDGFADLAVGVPGEDIGTTTDAGAVSVLYGTPTGLTGAGSQGFWQGSGGAAGTLEAFDVFGAALAAGDFNNDGFADLAVGVPGEDIGTSSGAGAANVLYGSVSGLTGSGSQVFSQAMPGFPGFPDTGDGFGFTLAVGDFDNDGFADLAVGVPFDNGAGPEDAGFLNVLYGSAGGLSATGAQAFWQGDVRGVPDEAEAFDWFGYALTVGDFNGDGSADVTIGVPGEDIGMVGDAGAVNVLYGSADGLTGTGSQAFRQGAGGVAGAAEFGDQLGLALTAGDFNQDGSADLAIGVPLENIGAIRDAGAANVLYGSPTGLTSTGNQLFWQGSGGAAGTVEADDVFGAALVGADQPTGPAAASSQARPAPPGAAAFQGR
jgi:hypothetical protein